MKSKKGVFFFMFACLCSAPLGLAQVTEWQLPNNMEVVHIQKPSTKVIASIVTVNVGSKDETSETNGLSHLLGAYGV